MVLVVDEVGSSGFGLGLVIRTWTNCRSAARIASPEITKPIPGSATEKTWSICPRSRLPSHETWVLIGATSLRGSISWQLSGRKWVKLDTSSWGRLHDAPLPSTGAAYCTWVTTPLVASLMSPILAIPGSAAWSWVKVVEAASLADRVTTFEARISAW
jgi:hypothetical protein